MERHRLLFRLTIDGAYITINNVVGARALYSFPEVEMAIQLLEEKTGSAFVQDKEDICLDTSCGIVCYAVRLGKVANAFKEVVLG